MGEFQILRIEKERAEALSGMLAKEAVSALEKDLPVTALAVVKGNAVIGALAGAVDGDFFDVISVYVDSEHRRKGAGTALMSKLFEFLDEMNLMARVEYAPVSDEADTLAPFLLSLGFDEDEVIYPTYFIEPLKDFDIDPDSVGGSGSKIISFSEAGEKVLAKADEELLLKNATLPIGGLLADTVDKKMSFCAVDKGKVKAFVAVEPGMDNLVEMSSIWSEDEDLSDIRIMLSYVLEELKEKYSPETKIMTLALGPEAEDFIKLICSRLKPVSVSYVKHYYEKI